MAFTHKKRKEETSQRQIERLANCPVTKKVSFVDKQSAKRARKQMAAHGHASPDELRVFRCEHCGNFHLGHSGKTSREGHRVRAAGLTLIQ
jgi:alanyl-tRNA synthetase